LGYIGNTPADKFLTLAKQSFSTSATTSYTLDSAVSSTQDIALFINNVRQSPVDAYTVSGTALTLTSATAGTDEMYCVYLGKTVGTVSPSVNSITNAMMTDDSVGLAELSATGTPSSSNFLRGDNSWAAAGVGDGDVTMAKLSTSGTEADNVKNRVGKVWVNFNGTGTIAIRDDFNVASLTDNGTGDYTVTYSADLGNDDYAVVAQTGRDESGSGGHNRLHAPCIDRYAVGSHRILCIDSDNDSARDMDSVFSIVLGDS
jgi:hypothetical protein